MCLGLKKYLKKRIEFHWGNEYYHMNEIPAYCLVTKIKNSYITTEKIIDGNLEKLSFISDELSKLYSIFSKGRGGSYKWFQTEFNRRDRNYNKQTLKEP
jgi:hypothetical protein